MPQHREPSRTIMSPQAILAALPGNVSLGQAGRYVGISGLAFALDISLFLLLLWLGAAAVPAAVAGYLAGTQLHWLLSIRFVFAEGLGRQAAERHRQQVLFFASAAAGVACHAGIVYLSERFGISVLIGKLAATGVSFALVFAVRATVIFARKRL